MCLDPPENTYLALGHEAFGGVTGRDDENLETYHLPSFNVDILSFN